MARTIQRPDPAQDTPISKTEDLLGITRTGTSTHLATDSASDNDTSERPVREKLKKTSIASMPRDNLFSSRAHVEAEEDDGVLSLRHDKDLISNEEPTNVCAGTRGRSLRKRSFDDLEPTESDAAEVGAQLARAAGGHARKRSRDVRVGAGLDGENRRRGAPELPVQEVEENSSDNEMVGLDDNPSPKSVPPPLIQDIVDQDMTDSALSPRKKRSRDQLDNDTDREQKIPATEEAKAQRRSEENERDKVSPGLDNGANSTGRGDHVDLVDHTNQVKYAGDSDLTVEKHSPLTEEGSTNKDTDLVTSSVNPINIVH